MKARSLSVFEHKLATPAILACLLLIVGVIGATGSPLIERTAIGLLINVVLVVALYMFSGNSGVVSFGHVSFMAIGAYSCAILTIPSVSKPMALPNLPGFLIDLELGPVAGILVSGLIAAVVALLLGVVVMRMVAFAATVGTFAILMIVTSVISRWDVLTGGSGIVVGVPLKTTIWTAVAWALVALAVAYAFQRSSVGLRLKALRDDEDAALACGLSPLGLRQIAWCLSAFLTGCAGALYAQFLGSLVTDTFFIKMTFIVLAMLVVGGIGSLSGAVIGAVGVSVLLEVFRRLEQGADLGVLDIPARLGLRELGLSALVLIVLSFRPSGITKSEEIDRWFLRSRLRRAPENMKMSGNPAPVSSAGGAGKSS